jgi:ATP synthase F1 delta subunit
MAVAHRMYARALDEAAQAQGRVDVARDEVAQVADALEATPELEAFLANPQLSPEAKADVLEEVMSGADPVVRNFVRVVAEKGRAGQLRAIADEFEAIVDAEQGRLKVELTTAYALAEDGARGRSRPDRRDDPPGRLAPRGRQCPRPPRTAPSRPRDPNLNRRRDFP